MKAEDLGIDKMTWRHSKLLSRAESIFLGILWTDYVGKANKISGIHLAEKFAYGLAGVILDPESPGREEDGWKRAVRIMHNHLLEMHDNIPVMSRSGPQGGYWIAETEDELTQFYYSFRQRGITGLRKATWGKKAGMIEAVEQLAFEFEDMTDKTAGIASSLPRTNEPIAPDIVDNLLSKMSQEPEKFASDLRKIREKYFSGAVLLEKDQLTAMQAKVQDVLSGLQEISG